MLRVRALSPLVAYLGLLLGIGVILAVSVTVLAGSLQAVRSPTKVESAPKRENVPLPPVIVPTQPKVERVLTKPVEIESSFASIGRPVAGEPVLGAGGPSDSFVVLGAPAEAE